MKSIERYQAKNLEDIQLVVFGNKTIDVVKLVMKNKGGEIDVNSD